MAGVTLVPIIATSATSNINYVTLDDGMRSGAVTVASFPNGTSRPS